MNSNGEIWKKCGVMRLQIYGILRVLSTIKDFQLIKKISENDFLLKILDSFENFPKNNFLHDTIREIIINIFNSLINNIDKKKSEFILDRLFSHLHNEILSNLGENCFYRNHIN